MEPAFLGVDDLLAIHHDQLQRYGGDTGIREPLLLQSAAAQPRATIEGRFVHDGLYEMAAAYLFHIVLNHPFVDGNKRTGAAAALVFLFINGVEVIADEESFADMVIEVAEGKVQKPAIAKFLKAAAS